MVIGNLIVGTPGFRLPGSAFDSGTSELGDGLVGVFPPGGKFPGKGR